MFNPLVQPTPFWFFDPVDPEPFDRFGDYAFDEWYDFMMWTEAPPGTKGRGGAVHHGYTELEQLGLAISFGIPMAIAQVPRVMARVLEHHPMVYMAKPFRQFIDYLVE